MSGWGAGAARQESAVVQTGGTFVTPAGQGVTVEQTWAS
jgi:hypothetical protein